MTQSLTSSDFTFARCDLLGSEVMLLPPPSEFWTSSRFGEWEEEEAETEICSSRSSSFSSLVLSRDRLTITEPRSALICNAVKSVWSVRSTVLCSSFNNFYHLPSSGGQEALAAAALLHQQAAPALAVPARVDHHPLLGGGGRHAALGADHAGQSHRAAHQGEASQHISSLAGRITITRCG